ncbi:MAG: endonuclease III domain-containing protein [Candidatus Methylomirabilia bacterium]
MKTPRWLRSAVKAPLTAEGISRVISRLKAKAPEWDSTAVAEVADQTNQDPFRILITCLLSFRTKDETTGPAADRLFALAKTPETISRLTPRQIERVIYPVGFYRTKARLILSFCRELPERFNGKVPPHLDALLTLPGVGRKTANLVITRAFALPGICVDTHVHRIVNRLGFVRTKTPEQTELALREKLPPRHWIEVNELLVAFGKNICAPLSPKCSICPVHNACHRVGVRRSR